MSKKLHISFQSYLDVSAFLAANPAVKTVKTYDGNTINTAVKADGELITCGAASTIAPAEAFFVELSKAAPDCTLQFAPQMFSSNASTTTTTQSKVRGLRLTAIAPNGVKASTLLLEDSTQSNITSSTLFDAEAKPQLSLFSIDETLQPFDVAQVSTNTERIPLGIYAADCDSLTLEAESIGGVQLSDYQLIDTKVNVQQSLQCTQPLSFKGSSVVLNRFVLQRTPSVVNSIVAPTNEKKTSSLQLSVSHRVLSLSLPEVSDQRIQQVTLYDVTGRLLSTVRYDCVHALTMPCPAGLLILHVTLSNGQDQTLRLWVE